MLKIKIKFYYQFIFFLFLSSVPALGFEDVDFDHSSGLDLMDQYSAKYAEPDADLKLTQLRENYERLKPSKSPLSATPIIPKVIHQIWLGTNPIPSNYKYYLETWKEYHPGWEIKLWTKEDIVKENFSNIDLFWLARSYMEQSDIARYEILYRYGGLYIDTDIECFSSFNDLHYKYDFYTNMEPPAINKKRVSILNAMIASVPKHPIIKNTLTQIREDWSKVEKIFDEKYSNSKSSFARSNHHLAVERTMYPFIDSVFKFLSQEDLSKYKTIILPSGYNVPVYFINDIPIINFLSRIFRDKAKLSNQIKKRPETMSIHYHDKENSLMDEDYFANSLFKHSEIKGMLYMLLNLRDKYYLAFRKLFQTKFPTVLQYRISPLIPKVIYLESDGLSAKDLADLKGQWQKMNPRFIVQALSSKDLIQFIPKKFNALKLPQLMARFYLLQKKGGVYIESGFKPASLEEFNHKYGYYGKFNKMLGLSDKLSLSTSIIAAAENHSIMRNMLLHLEEELANGVIIDQDQIKKDYIEYAYKYYELDGESIILPEMYFKQKR